MKLIPLTSEYGGPIMINPDNIVYIENYTSREDKPQLTEIAMIGGHRLVCKETQEEIKFLLSGATFMTEEQAKICNREHVDDVKTPNIYE